MRHLGWGVVVACLLSLPSFAAGASLLVQVTDQNGQPVADAVVTVVPPAPWSGAANLRSTSRTIDQKQLTFMPYVEVFRPGDSVVFRNSDSTRHHVYSFSPAKAFEFVVAPGESAAPLVLDKTGVVAVGCNIHDGMISYLYITDAPYYARTDARGRVSFDALPPGRYDVRVWQPRLPPGRPDLRERALVIAAGESKTLAFPITLRPDPRQQFDREHTHY
ncbi:carboxypeptidase regulatory-like domain-containing protein [Lysobacter sp. KIS68-7]|uniref:carboxypeptidase regulatory-like domain-containing protein n=1 Tax=Lysobacter sp. KIS68-7 TaxID=2904252 RepID=UPI001E522B72|nr:carboxypeptidase regulatory-like domain-containing protein [Lysobacter sp. KIS68-7]UHQ19107.1 carboxypeptidase regulatory-like domain-containing protein [Lysobacter sp. KIS68-7]